MIYKAVCAMLTVGALGIGGTCGAAEVLHHQIEVLLEPAERTIQVADTLRLDGAVSADAGGAYRFVLHAGLTPEVVTPGWRLQPVDGPVKAGFFGINATTETVSENVPLEGAAAALRDRVAAGKARYAL